jgi:hypothetical protein
MHITSTVDFDMERQEIHAAFSSAFYKWEKNDEDSEEKAEQSRICRQILRQNGESGFVREAEIMWIIELIEQRIAEFQNSQERIKVAEKEIGAHLSDYDKEFFRESYQRSKENNARGIEQMEKGIKVLQKGAKLIATATAWAIANQFKTE